MKIFPAIGLIFLLAACGERPVVYTPVAVNIPIAEKCNFNIPTVPKYKLSAVPLTASLSDKTKAALSDLTASKTHIRILRAAIEVCNDRGNSQPSANGNTSEAPPYQIP